MSKFYTMKVSTSGRSPSSQLAQCAIDIRIPTSGSTFGWDYPKTIRSGSTILTRAVLPTKARLWPSLNVPL